MPLRLPDGLDLDDLARRTNAIESKRAISSGADLSRTVLARGPGVNYRLDKPVAFLDAVRVGQLAALKRKKPGILSTICPVQGVGAT